MSELLAWPEIEQGADELTRLHEIVQSSCVNPENPAETMTAQKQRLQHIIETAQAQEPSQHARNKLAHYGMVVDYMWFGPPVGDQPEGIGFFWSGYIDRPEWGLMEMAQSHLTEQTFEHITALLLPSGLSELLATRQRIAATHTPEVETMFEAVIGALPGGKWVKACMAKEAEEAPLTPAQRGLKEPGIYAMSAAKIGANPFQPARPHPMALRHAQRGLSLLDDETSIQQRTPKSPRTNPVARFVLGRVDSLRETALPTTQTYNPESAELIDLDPAGAPIAKHDVMAIAYESEGAANLKTSDTEALNIMSREFYADALAASLEDLPSVSAVYENAIGHSKETFLRPILEGMQLDSARAFMAAVNYLKRMPEGTRPLPMQPGHGEHEVSQYQHAGIVHLTHEAYEADRNTIVGIVEKYANPRPGTLRLLYFDWREDGALPRKPQGAADLIVSLKGVQNDPIVPGYKLIAADRLANRYYFTYQPGGDPYNPAHSPKITESLTGLIHQYSTLLPRLGRGTKKLKDLSVYGLAAVVQKHSQYAFRSPSSPDNGDKVKVLGDFHHYIQSRKLVGTCAVFAHFGKQSCDTFMDPQRTRVRTGLVLDEGFITAATHAQLEITDEQNNVISMQEWTPPSGSTGPQPDAQVAVQELLSEPVVVPLDINTPEETLVHTPQHNTAHARAVVQQSLQSLLMQLSIVLSPDPAVPAPESAVLQQLKSFGHRNPLTATVSALLRAEVAAAEQEVLPVDVVSACADALALIRQQRLQAMHRRPPLKDSRHDMAEAALLPVLHIAATSPS
ncbi:MAG TPA: hypothetical protein VD735_05295 [Candidatus Saccharimonadales bacterium]|nr:hypothetical protein [Candidatus Saccharimonadales bacterium]